MKTFKGDSLMFARLISTDNRDDDNTMSSTILYLEDKIQEEVDEA